MIDEDTPISARTTAILVVGLGMAAAWWTWLRPVPLGGPASYVIVQGESMEPTYDDGDLVLVREASGYTDGDVIAFRVGGRFDDQTRIIHRIVGEAGDGTFQTQGDNREELDPWTPGPDDIIGKASLHVPMAGRAAGLLTNPATFAALGGTAVIVGGERRRRRRRRPSPPHRQELQTMKHVKRIEPLVARPIRSSAEAPSRVGRLTEPRWAFVGLVASCLLALPVLTATWSALHAPDSSQRVIPVGHADGAIGLDYRFTGEPSPVYPEGEVTASKTPTGAAVADGPLYSRLLDALEVELDFRAAAEGAGDLATSYTIDVSVETPAGWSTPLDSVEATSFDGTASETLAIDLRQVARTVTAVAELTGVGGDVYTITVTPTLDLTGASDAGPVQKQLTAPMTFAVENGLVTASAVDASESSELTRTISERATYAVGPLEMGTQAARGLLGGLTLVLVAAIAWFASVLFGGVGLGEPERIAARYRSQIIDVAEAAAPPGPVVMVSAIDELARIAKLEQTVILHEDLGDGAHRYRVFLGTVTYEFETAPEHGGGVTEHPADVDESEADPTVRRVLLFAALLVLVGLSTAFAASFSTQSEDVASFTTNVSISVPTTATTYYLSGAPVLAPNHVPGLLHPTPPIGGGVNSKRIDPDTEATDEQSTIAPADKVHSWQTDGTGLVLSGPATAWIYQNGGDAPVAAGLFVCATAATATSACDRIAGDVESGPRVDGEVPIAFGDLSTPVPSGSRLRLVIVNHGPGSFNVQWGYKTNRESRLELTVAP